MTEKQVLVALSDWQDWLGLNAWNIELAFNEPADLDNEAEIEHPIHYDRATIRLAANWKTWAPLKLHQLLVHELLHLTTRDLEQAYGALKNQVHPDVWSVTESRCTHEIEGVIDRLAVRIVEIAGFTS